MVCSIHSRRVAVKLTSLPGLLAFFHGQQHFDDQPVLCASFGLACFFLQVKVLDVDEGCVGFYFFSFFLIFGELCFLAR